MIKNFQKKRGWKNILQSRPVLVFLAVLVFVSAYGVLGFLGKMQITVENRKIAENKVATLQREKEKLSFDITKLESQDGVEASIREKFGLAKEGEGVIIIMEDKKGPEVIEKPSEGFLSSLFFWKNWFK